MAMVSPRARRSGLISSRSVSTMAGGRFEVGGQAGSQVRAEAGTDAEAASDEFARRFGDKHPRR